MGRNAGDLALYASMAGGGDGILIPEQDNPIEVLAYQIQQRRRRGKLHDIILVAEGVGSAHTVAEELKKKYILT